MGKTGGLGEWVGRVGVEGEGGGGVYSRYLYTRVRFPRQLILRASAEL